MAKYKTIAHIQTDFKEKFGIPRQSGRVEGLIGKIIFEKEYADKNAIEGLENFSHLWIVFEFSESVREKFSPTVRPPRLGGNKRVGVFASRSPFRPNPIGLSCVKIEKIEKNTSLGPVITVSGIDILDSTPILDIKPYIPYTDCRTEATGGFSDKFKQYRLDISFDEDVLSEIKAEKRQSLVECIQEDPRPSYQNNPDKIYKMLFDGFNVHFTVNSNEAKIIKVEKRKI